MTREEAEVERERIAQKHPEDTWIIAEGQPGSWSVFRLGLRPTAVDRGETVESRPRPPHADDPRTAHDQNAGPYVGPV